MSLFLSLKTYFHVLQKLTVSCEFNSEATSCESLFYDKSKAERGYTLFVLNYCSTRGESAIFLTMTQLTKSLTYHGYVIVLEKAD